MFPIFEENYSWNLDEIINKFKVLWNRAQVDLSTVKIWIGRNVLTFKLKIHFA